MRKGRKWVYALAGVIVLSMAVFIYAQLMLRFGSGTPPQMQPAEVRADTIEVDKSEQRMVLYRDGQPLREYSIALGANPEGHKTEGGDERTPVGEYTIDWRNANSIAHLSLHISYPNAEDIQQAEQRGVSPGGNIMIHGMTNGWGWLISRLGLRNWTDGCIAISNDEMEEIWSLVANGTPIRIQE